MKKEKKTFRNILLAAAGALFLSCMVTISTLKGSTSSIRSGCDEGIYCMIYYNEDEYYEGTCKPGPSNFPYDCRCGDYDERPMMCTNT